MVVKPVPITFQHLKIKRILGMPMAIMHTDTVFPKPKSEVPITNIYLTGQKVQLGLIRSLMLL